MEIATARGFKVLIDVLAKGDVSILVVLITWVIIGSSLGCDTDIKLGPAMGGEEGFAKPVNISHVMPTHAVMGVPYELVLQATGTPLVSSTRSTPYNWWVRPERLPDGSLTGQLPDGLSLNYSTGVISGIPVQAGVFDFTVSARGHSLTDTAEFRITVLP